MKIKKTFVIAEAGVNHNGSLKNALKMIDVAKKSGADAIKFQAFNSSEIASKFTPLANYQKKQKTTTQYSLLNKLELSEQSLTKIKKYCDKKGITFMASAFDIASLRFLKKLNLKIFKIPSGEINNLPYLNELGKYNKKILLSTGASEIKDIKFAIDTLVKSGTKKKNICIMHCNSEYPTPMRDANLNAIKYLKTKFNNEIGYSDHTLGIEASIVSVVLGAKVIEKHFTLDKKKIGPDHKASISGKELSKLVECVRNIEIAVGIQKKFITKSEKKNQKLIRKSIVAKININKDDIFSEKNITCKRPGYGIPPTLWKNIIGKKAKKIFKKDQLIKI